MRRIIVCGVLSALITIQSAWTQSQAVNEMANGLTELTGSFWEHLNHHSNTIKASNLTGQFKRVLEDMYQFYLINKDTGEM